MKGSTFKRCRCRDSAGKDLGAKCLRLKRKDGSWNSRHGSWYYQLGLDAGPGGKRNTLRRGGFETQDEAQDALDEAKRKIKKGVKVARKAKVGPEFDKWLRGKRRIRASTDRGYESIGKVHIKPHLGHMEVGALDVDDVDHMFEEIDAENERIIQANEQRARLRKAAKDAGRARDYACRRALEEIAELPRWKRATGPVTKQRIRDCLRHFLNHCVARGLTSVNVAELVELGSAQNSRPVVWTTERVEEWSARYQEAVAEVREASGGRFVDLFGIWRSLPRPSKVMVWTPAQTGVFLQYAVRHRLYAAYHLIAFTGLRRGEACGAERRDLDLAKRELAIRTRHVQIGWEVQEGEPKTGASDAPVTLDVGTAEALRAHLEVQREDQQAWGAWVKSEKIFVRENGEPLHPATLTGQFLRLAFEAGLPPIRLHDLCHGTATLGLAAGLDMKVVSARLRHSSVTFTSDAYTSILPDVAREAAERVAAMVPLPKDLGHIDDSVSSQEARRIINSMPGDSMPVEDED